MEIIKKILIKNGGLSLGKSATPVVVGYVHRKIIEVESAVRIGCCYCD